MPSDSPRSWHRLHAVTWIAGAVVAAALAAVNLSGEASWWGHYQWGWPIVWATREPHVFVIDSYEAYEGLPFRPDRAAEFFPLRLLGNAFLIVAILAGNLWMIERWRRAQRIPSQLGLKWLLAAMAWAACYALINRTEWRWSYHVSQIAFSLAYLALGVAWLAVFDIVGAVWNRVTHRRK